MNTMVCTGNIKGCSLIWPEISRDFLALIDISVGFKPRDREQEIYQELLLGFDAITSCELKELYRFKLYLQNIMQEDIESTALSLIVCGFVKWVDFDYKASREIFLQHLCKYPGDVIAIFFIHMLDFCTGRTSYLIGEFRNYDSYIKLDHPLLAFYLAIKAFVLCECELFDEALSIGLQSVELNKKNIYGIHAVSHALHEKKMWLQLCEFLEASKKDWINNPGMKMHVYWHLAIAYKKINKIDESKIAFKELYALKNNRYAKQDLDAVGFLWRLKLDDMSDCQFDETWRDLAILWSGNIGASTSHFHNIHAALAFAGAKKLLLIEKLIAESDGFGMELNTQLVGLDVLNGIAMFARGRYGDCYNYLFNSQSMWIQLGGSRAQRELLYKTMMVANKRMTLQNNTGINR